MGVDLSTTIFQAFFPTHSVADAPNLMYLDARWQLTAKTADVRVDRSASRSAVARCEKREKPLTGDDIVRHQLPENYFLRAREAWELI